MTAAERLRALATQATPLVFSLWREGNSVRLVGNETDARLIGLAPDLAAWCADAAEVMRQVYPTRASQDLLARLDEIVSSDDA